MVTTRRLLSYTTPIAAILYVLGTVLGLITLLVGVMSSSTLLVPFGLAGASLMWWPIIRDLVPVAWSVTMQGQWPIKSK